MINQLSPCRSWTHLQHRQGGWLVSGHHSRLALAVELLAHLGSLAPSCLWPAVRLLHELKLRDSAYADCVELLRRDLDSRTRALRPRATVLVATASGHPSAREAVLQ